MINKNILCYLTLTFRVSPLWGRLHSFCGAWQRCNSLKWNDHFASLRLALHRKNHTLRPVQLPDLGLSVWTSAGRAIVSSCWQPVGLEESKRKCDWVRIDFDDFEGQ